MDSSFDVSDITDHYPLGSQKREQNAYQAKVAPMTLTSEFLSPGNLHYLTKRAMEVQRSTAGSVYQFQYFQRIIPEYAEKWAILSNLDDSEPLGPMTSVELLEHFNKTFLDEHYELLRMPQGHEMPGITGMPDVNLFRQQIGVINADGNPEFKLAREIQADDYSTLGMQTPDGQLTTASARHYRYGNRISHRNICGGGSRKVAMVDRGDIDGLQTRRADEASLETLVRGFDMSSIRSGTYTLTQRTGRCNPFASKQRIMPVGSSDGPW